MVLGASLVFSANSSDVIAVVLPVEYVRAGFALKLLSLGMVFFAMMIVSIAILNSSGYIYRALILGTITLFASIVINSILIYLGGASIKAVEFAALGSSLAMLVGAILSQREVYKLFGVLTPVASIFRGLISFSICYGVAYLIPSYNKLATIGESILIFVLYFVLLLTIGELKKEDKRLLLRIFSRS